MPRVERHATGGAGTVGPRYVQEHGAATVGDPWPRIVRDLDHQVVEVIVAPEAVAWFIGRPAEGTVVAAVGGILAPGQRPIDPPDRQAGGGPRQPIGAPPQAQEPEPSARRRAVAFALAGRNAGTLTLILAGVALSSCAIALTSLALNLAPSPLAASAVRKGKASASASLRPSSVASSASSRANFRSGASVGLSATSSAARTNR